LPDVEANNDIAIENTIDAESHAEPTEKPINEVKINNHAHRLFLKLQIWEESLKQDEHDYSAH
jgi:hypothetical protein